MRLKFEYCVRLWIILTNVGVIFSEEASRGPSPPPPPERSDSLGAKAEEEEKALLAAPWFQAGIPREIALEVLAQEPVGSFMVRESTTKIGCYALSLRVPRDFQPSGIAHYLIMRTNRGYRIKVRIYAWFFSAYLFDPFQNWYYFVKRIEIFNQIP